MGKTDEYEIVKYNGILVPFVKKKKPRKEKPDAEEGIVSAHKNFTKSKDNVIIIGGGNGVTACVASKIVGEFGNVVIYEGGNEAYKRIKRTMKINNAPNNYQVYHAIIGPEIDVYGGDTTGAQFIDPKDIANCDVLELDCEGSEESILENMVIRPRIIIAEIHPKTHKSPDSVVNILINMGYKIIQQSGHNGGIVTNEELSYLLYKGKIFDAGKHNKKYRFIETIKGELARFPMVVVGEKNEQNK